MVRKFVISGGPSTGKTSIINELEKEFKVFHEIARQVLKNKEFNEKTQYEIFKKQLQQLYKADKLEGIVFFDRGIPDALAYFRYHNFEISEEVIKNSKKENTDYELTFFLDTIPYKKDDIRKENEEEAKLIHKMIYDTYRELGYKVVKVPFISVKKRVDFIKSFL